MSKADVLANGFNGLTSAQPTLPSHWYYDGDHYDRECREIWGKTWICLGRSEGLVEAGDFRKVRIAGQDILLVRSADGALRGFHNTCRHRGSALCTADEGRLTRGRITCPYHQWTYALDGRLLSTGAMRPVDGFDRDRFGLLPIAIAHWGGFVFANMAGPGADPFPGPAEDELAQLANWPMADLTVGHSYRRALNCNWKIFWENYNECLHCPNIHPELCELVPIYGRGLMARRDDPGWTSHADDDRPAFSGGLRDGAGTWSLDGVAQDRLPGLTDADVVPGHRYATLLPSVFIAAHADYVRSVRILPLAPERTEIRAEWLFHPDTLERPGFDMTRITEFATLVMDQDGDACELNQGGLRAAGFGSGVLMQEEYEVFLFQDWIRAALGEPRLGPEAESRASRRQART